MLYLDYLGHWNLPTPIQFDLYID